MSFNITVDDLLPLPDVCPALGIRIDYGFKHKCGPNDNSPSIDRIDPRKGYVRGNVWVISQRANRIKNDGTSAELRKIANAVDRRRKCR